MITLCFIKNILDQKKQRCKYQHSDMAEDHMELVFLWQDMMWVVSKNKDLNLEHLPWVILALFPLSYAASCWMIDALFQKQVQVTLQGFQTREN